MGRGHKDQRIHHLRVPSGSVYSAGFHVRSLDNFIRDSNNVLYIRQEMAGHCQQGTEMLEHHAPSTDVQDGIGYQRHAAAAGHASQ
jgi:hypothetical protein